MWRLIGHQLTPFSRCHRKESLDLIELRLGSANEIISGWHVLSLLVVRIDQSKPQLSHVVVGLELSRTLSAAFDLRMSRVVNVLDLVLSLLM